MDTEHFKMDFSVKQIYFFFTSITVSKLYYTYYHLILLMIVCIVQYSTVLQESGNLKNKNKISKLVLAPTPPPFLGQRPTF